VTCALERLRLAAGSCVIGGSGAATVAPVAAPSGSAAPGAVVSVQPAAPVGGAAERPVAPPAHAAVVGAAPRGTRVCQNTTAAAEKHEQHGDGRLQPEPHHVLAARFGERLIGDEWTTTRRGTTPTTCVIIVTCAAVAIGAASADLCVASSSA